MKKTYYVYILTSKSFTLYIGVTSNLIKRVWDHKSKLVDGFTKRYNIDKLIYFEEFKDAKNAINREKELKGWTRKKKIDLIKTVNHDFEEINL